MSIRVSIVVPVYNSHATLPKCLESLIAQTWQDLEIICINDKSKDNSIDIIKEYQQKDNRVKLVDHAENMNAGGARNSGIRAATGDYVCFCDNDDWMTPDAIEILVKASNNGKIDFVLPQWCQYWNESKHSMVQNLIIGGTKKEICDYALLHGYRMLGCLIRRDIFYKYDLFFPEKSFFEDNAIAMSLLFSANQIKVVDNLLYYYQMVEGSSSRSISFVKIRDRIKTSDLAVGNLNRLGFVNEENRTKIDYLYLCYCYHTIRMLATVNDKESKSYLIEIIKKVKPLMPNEYLRQYHRDFIQTLSKPLLFYYIWKSVHGYKQAKHKVHLFLLNHHICYT